MKINFAIIGLLSLLVAGQVSGQDCAADGDVQFLCGPVSPEDLAQVPETNWIVASGMEDDGYLYLVNSDSLNTESVYPSANANHQWDRQLYAACPGPQTEEFRPHGLHLVPGENNSHL